MIVVSDVRELVDSKPNSPTKYIEGFTSTDAQEVEALLTRSGFHVTSPKGLLNRLANPEKNNGGYRVVEMGGIIVECLDIPHDKEVSAKIGFSPLSKMRVHVRGTPNGELRALPSILGEYGQNTAFMDRDKCKMCVALHPLFAAHSMMIVNYVNCQSPTEGYRQAS